MSVFNLLLAWSVPLLVTFVSHAKTAELIEMSFGVVTQVGPRIHVLDGALISRERAIFWGKWLPIVSRSSLQCIDVTRQVVLASHSTCLKVAHTCESWVKYQHCADIFASCESSDVDTI